MRPKTGPRVTWYARMRARLNLVTARGSQGARPLPEWHECRRAGRRRAQWLPLGRLRRPRDPLPGGCGAPRRGSRESASAPGCARRPTCFPSPQSPPATDHPCEESGSEQPARARRCPSCARRRNASGPTGAVRGSPRGCRRQSLAPFPAPRSEHLAAAWRAHANAKPMSLPPVALLGLVGPLDGLTPTRI
jgi:hypothetical protein